FAAENRSHLREAAQFFLRHSTECQRWLGITRHERLRWGRRLTHACLERWTAKARSEARRDPAAIVASTECTPLDPDLPQSRCAVARLRWVQPPPPGRRGER